MLPERLDYIMSGPKIEVLPIEKAATPDMNNVNQHTQKGGALLENELRKRGAFRSIASAGKDTETPVVYAGNYTLEKAVDAGFKEVVNVYVDGSQLVNVVRTDLAPGSPEAIALGISDNEIGKQSYSPDVDILAALAAGDNAILSELRREDKLLNSMVEGMGLKEEAKDAPVDVDRAAELLEKWQVQPGDLWQIGEHRLICGDCTDAATVVRVMDGERAAMCFTSPPYNAGDNKLGGNKSMVDSKYRNSDDDLPQDEYKELLIAFTRAMLDVCQVVAINLQSLSGNKIAVIEWLYEFRNHFIDRAIWFKGYGQPAMAKNVMNSRFEDIYLLSPCEQPTRAIETADFHGTVPNVYEGKGASGENVAKEAHAATFPLHLPLWALQSFNGVKGTVIDPFLGSGTSLVACEQFGCHGRGIELDPAYVAVALERMAQAFPGIEIRKLENA